MLKVAITGNIAAGKSVVENILRTKGHPVLDTDAVVHDLLKRNDTKSQVREQFASYDIFEGEEISRPKLGKVVFADNTLRAKLESIIHPRVKEEIAKFFQLQETMNKKMAFVSVPLLFETGFDKLFNKIILVYANDDIRLKRLMERNDLPLEYAKNRLKIQMSQDEKKLKADFIVFNNTTFEDVEKNLEEALNLL